MAAKKKTETTVEPDGTKVTIPAGTDGRVVFAGDDPGWVVESGACVKIMTGAALPEGADAVVMVEYTQQAGPDEYVFLGRIGLDDFNEIMERAQKATYGEGLDERYLQKYMWTWKPHYYSVGRSFYNFPYAFGLLFGTGLYAIYQERGNAFVPEYRELLASTGKGTAAALAARFGIDTPLASDPALHLSRIGQGIKYCRSRGVDIDRNLNVASLE